MSSIELTDEFIGSFFNKLAEKAGLTCEFSLLSKDDMYIASFIDENSLKEIHVDLLIAPAAIIELRPDEFDESRIDEYAEIIKRVFSEKSQEIIEYNKDNKTLQ